MCFGNCYIIVNINNKIFLKMKKVPSIRVGIQICDTACAMKFADTHVALESLARKSMAQRNLKHKVPSIRTLSQP